MAITKLFGKKKKLGFAEKQRSREEISQEYNHHAVMHGHLARIIAQDQEVMQQNQNAMDEHVVAMVKLHKELAKLPPPEAPKPTEPQGPDAA
jgi:hypothetical protein